MSGGRRSVLRRIAKTLAHVREARHGRDHHVFLPVIEESLDHMRKNIDASSETRNRMAAALGRIVTEDYAFSLSELGLELLRIADAFAEIK